MNEENEKKLVTRIAKELAMDSAFWRAWWTTHGTRGVRASELLTFCGAFVGESEHNRVSVIGSALTTLARRRVAIGLAGSEPILPRRHIVRGAQGERFVVVQNCPNELNPLKAGHWRLWPVPQRLEAAAGPPWRKISTACRSALFLRFFRRKKGPPSDSE